MKEIKYKIEDLHKLLVVGLTKGLSHTHQDGRLEDINFWRKRSELFNVFSLAVMNLIWDNYNVVKNHEKELKEIAEEGYKK